MNIYVNNMATCNIMSTDSVYLEPFPPWIVTLFIDWTRLHQEDTVEIDYNTLDLVNVMVGRISRPYEAKPENSISLVVSNVIRSHFALF